MSKQATAHYDLGFAYSEMGMIEDALTELELALRLDPRHHYANAASSLIKRLEKLSASSVRTLTKPALN